MTNATTQAVRRFYPLDPLFLEGKRTYLSSLLLVLVWAAWGGSEALADAQVYTNPYQGGSPVSLPVTLQGYFNRSSGDYEEAAEVGFYLNPTSSIPLSNGLLDKYTGTPGTMVVHKGLPVQQQLAGVLDKTITDSRKNLLVDAQTISLAAKRLEFQNTTMAAMSAITARANTVLLNNANFTVISQNGMINFYTQQGLVNRTYGSDGASDNGMLNFSGVNNFRIGNNSFTVQDQATLNQHYGNNIVDMNQNFGRPEAGKVNVLKM